MMTLTSYLPIIRQSTTWSGQLWNGFGEDVDYYGIFHEANHPKYWDGSWDELLDLFVLPATRAIRDYGEETRRH